MNELLGFASTFAWIFSCTVVVFNNFALALPHDNRCFFFQVRDQLFNAPVVLRILDVDILVVSDAMDEEALRQAQEAGRS